MLLQLNTDETLYVDNESDWIPPKPTINIFRHKLVDLFGKTESDSEEEKLDSEVI